MVLTIPYRILRPFRKAGLTSLFMFVSFFEIHVCSDRPDIGSPFTCNYFLHYFF